MSNDDFNPNSVDAVLSRMEERQKANCVKLDKVLEKLESHDKRISGLERWKFLVIGAATGVSMAVQTAWEVITRKQ